MSVSLDIPRSVPSFIHLFIHKSINPSIYSLVHPAPSFWWTVCTSAQYPSVIHTFHISICPSFHLFIRLSSHPLCPPFSHSSCLSSSSVYESVCHLTLAGEVVMTHAQLTPCGYVSVLALGYLNDPASPVS